MNLPRFNLSPYEESPEPEKLRKEQEELELKKAWEATAEPFQPLVYELLRHRKITHHVVPSPRVGKTYAEQMMDLFNSGLLGPDPVSIVNQNRPIA